MGIYGDLSELDTQSPPSQPIEVQVEEAKPAQVRTSPDNHTRAKVKAQKSHVSPKKPGANQYDNTTRNITLLQFDETDIERLREATDKVQTYRLTEREIEWVKDTAYRLSKEVKRGKVSQGDILRIALLLIENLLGTHKVELLHILERMK